MKILPAVLYVDDSTVGGNGDGMSWANAFSGLQAALGQAVVGSGQEIHVAGGTYKPTSINDRTVSFQLKNGVAVLGGYAGISAPAARDIVLYPTILSGDIGATPNNADNSYHVVVGSGTDGTAILDGFTIFGGNANGTSPNDSGGGVYDYYSSPTIRNCIFSGNTASSGGGMYNASYSSPTLSNCTFSGNSASNSGGGMYNVSSSATLSNCTFSGNSAMGTSIYSGYGGGMDNSDSSSATLSNCTFSGNSASHSGGGMDNSVSSSATLSNCTFSGNSASISGGGMYNFLSSPALANCTFSGNTATGTSGSGGGVYNESSSPTLTSCTFSGNSASSSGGGMYNYYSSSATLSNCAFSGNTTTYSGGGMYNSSSSPTLSNCAFSGNRATGTSGYGGGMYNSSSSPTLSNCTFSGNTATIYGGGMDNYNSSFPSLTNCTFSGNRATGTSGYGGAMYNYSTSPTLTNCIFSGNTASFYGGAMYNYSTSPTLTNCIVWGNTATNGPQIYQSGSGSSIINYSDIQGGWSGGSGNINAPPQFIRNPSAGPDITWGTADDDYGDLRLMATSPCIDVGSDGAVSASITTDLAGNPRKTDLPGVGTAGVKVDMGAYEKVGFPTNGGRGGRAA